MLFLRQHTPDVSFVMTQELDRKGLEILFDLFFLSFLFDLARVPGKVGPSQGLSGEPDG